MIMRMSEFRVLLGILSFSALCACQTISRQAPPELKDAEKSISAARKADVEDYMPSAMEAAERKLSKSIALLNDAADFREEGGSKRATIAREESIKLAKEAKAIADGATHIVADMRAYDRRSDAYLSANAKNERVNNLEDEIDHLKKENTELEAKYGQLSSDSKTFAERPSQMVVPSEFTSGKPIAYFATGSTILEARFRPDIQELAALMKGNSELQLTLEGFADPRGSVTLNKRLAEKRLHAVADELAANGVNKEKIKLVTVGATADRAAAAGARSGELQLDRKVMAKVSTPVH